MEIKTACPLKACWIKTCFSDTTILFMQEEKEKYSWILVKSLPLFYPSTSKCSRNSHPLKKKKDSKVNSQRHSGKNKSCFFTSEPLHKVRLKASEPAEMRTCCGWGLCHCEPPRLCLLGPLGCVHTPALSLCHCWLLISWVLITSSVLPLWSLK